MQYSYDTVSDAVKGLRDRNFTIDFNLQNNCLACDEHRFEINDFEITEIHRFEGDSDPADEAVVYAIESKNGLKGILVSGYGISADEMSDEIAKKLSIHRL